MAKGSTSFKINTKKAKEHAKKIRESRGSRDGADFFKCKNDTTTKMRIIPSPSEEARSQGKVGKIVYKMFLKWDNEVHGTHVCGAETDPDKYEVCPISDAINTIQDYAPSEALDEMRPKARAYFNVFVRSEKNNKTGEVTEVNRLVIMDAPRLFYDWVQTSFIDDDIGIFVDPYDGVDILFKRQGDFFARDHYNFSVASGKNVEWGPILSDEKKLEELLSKAVDLDKYYTLTTERLVEQKDLARELIAWGKKMAPEGDLDDLEGSDTDIEDAPDDPEEEEEKPKKRATKKAKAGGPEIDPDTKRPVCYGDWSDRNPGQEEDEESTDKVCQVCQYVITCQLQ